MTFKLEIPSEQIIPPYFYTSNTFSGSNSNYWSERY